MTNRVLEEEIKIKKESGMSGFKAPGRGCSEKDREGHVGDYSLASMRAHEYMGESP